MAKEIGHSDNWRVPGRRFVRTWDEPNSKGERIAAEFTLCENHRGKSSLMAIWKKKGYVDCAMETWWSVERLLLRPRRPLLRTIQPHCQTGGSGIRHRLRLDARGNTREHGKALSRNRAQGVRRNGAEHLFHRGLSTAFYAQEVKPGSYMAPGLWTGSLFYIRPSRKGNGIVRIRQIGRCALFSWDVFHTSRCRGTSWPSGP